MSEWEQLVDQLAIVPSGGGVFEVVVDGDLIFSKKKTGRHAEPGEVESIIRGRA